MSLLDKVKASAIEHRPGARCATCELLTNMSAADLAEYHEAAALVGTVVDGVKITTADVGRAIGLQPGTYRQHVTNGHREPR